MKYIEPIVPIYIEYIEYIEIYSTDNFPGYRNRNLIYPGNVVMAISSLDEIRALCIV